MTDTYFGKMIELTESHNNAAIKVHILSESEMRKIGFTDYNPKKWYFCRYGMGGISDISFSVSVAKDNPEDWRIDILDENFLQPYDYQHMLEMKSTHKTPKKVQKDVEHWMSYLAEKGVLEGHEYGEYI